MKAYEHPSPVLIRHQSSLLSIPGLLAFRRDVIPEETLDDAVQVEDKAPDFSRIRCPLCAWQPQATNRWYCADCGHPEYFSSGCGMIWNTFATRGLCPGCGHQWRWTVCLRCFGWSRHEAWYITEEKPS